jgi:hypothetical protein
MNSDIHKHQTIVPDAGGSLVVGDVLEGLSRVPDGVAQVVYITPPFETDDLIDKNSSPEIRKYLRRLGAVLRHAWRVTHEHGSLFVRSPAFHPHLNMALVLGQVCDGKEPHRISRRIITPGKHQDSPRYDRETIYYIPRSNASIYYAPTTPHQMTGAKETDSLRGPYRLVDLSAPKSSSEPDYTFHGRQPPTGRMWRFSAQRMEQLLAAGDIDLGSTGLPRLRRYLSEIPPVKLSMEWDDIPAQPPALERAKGAGPENQEPEAILERIISMSSDPLGLVIVPFCETGTAVSVSAKLERKWLGFSSSQDGIDYCHKRLERLDPHTRGPASLSSVEDYAHLPVAPVESTEILGSSADVVSTRNAVERLRLLPWHSIPELVFAEHLMRNGVLSVPQLSVPGVSGMVFDFFLPQPPRAVVDLCSEHGFEGEIPRMIRVADDVRGALGASTKVYLVVLHQNRVSEHLQLQLRDSGVRLIEGESPELAAIALAADFLLPQMAGPSFAEDSPFLPDPDEFSPEFMAMALTYEGLLTSEDRSVLRHELEQLRSEWKHQHFTAAALRVGRSIEYVVYSACRSWDVPVREPVLAALKRLEDRFDEMRRALMNYSANSHVGKKKVLEKAHAINGDVLVIISDIDEAINRVQEGPAPPRNVHSMLNDIRKKYGMLQDVREAIEKQDKPISRLLELRNAAAHASVDGQPREVSAEDLKRMVDLLNVALNELAKCGLAIQAYKKTTLSSQ